jgi:hypothetical protein
MYHRGFQDTITYWAVASTDEYGKKTYSAPATISGRWEDRAVAFRDKHGQENVSKSVVYLESGIELDGYLFNGTSVASTPIGLEGAWEIQQTSTVNDLRKMRTLYTAFL